MKCSITFLYKREEWLDQSWIRISFSLELPGLTQPQKQKESKADISPCFSLDSIASHLFLFMAYCRVWVTFFKMDKCQECRCTCSSPSCSGPFGHVREHPQVLGWDSGLVVFSIMKWNCISAWIGVPWGWGTCSYQQWLAVISGASRSCWSSADQLNWGSYSFKCSCTVRMHCKYTDLNCQFIS